jgi:hypothetical protein
MIGECVYDLILVIAILISTLTNDCLTPPGYFSAKSWLTIIMILYGIDFVLVLSQIAWLKKK